MHKDIETILFTEEQIKERVRQLGAELRRIMKENQSFS